MLKALCGSQQTVENSSRAGNTRPPYQPPEKPVCRQVKKQQLKPDTEQQTGSKLGKEYVKAVYGHPAYLTYMQSKYIMRDGELEEAQAGLKIARRNINNLRYADDPTLMAESEEELKSLLMTVKEESEKVGLKLTFRKRRSWLLVPQKMKIMASGPTTSWE